MKIKIYNHSKIKEAEIHDRVIRVKALIVNSKKEILLGESFGTIQFPGGHVEENESFKQALKREVKEETGIELQEELEPFFAIKHFLKDYPVVGNNRSVEIYYFYIKTDEPYHLEKTNLDDQEKTGNFTLQYVPLKKVKRVLIASLNQNQINRIVTKEMLQALKSAKRLYK